MIALLKSNSNFHVFYFIFTHYITKKVSDKYVDVTIGGLVVHDDVIQTTLFVKTKYINLT